MNTDHTVYDYTPTQARLVELYDQYRTCLMNAKYYAKRLVWLKRVNTWSDIAVAIATSSAFAGFAIGKNARGGQIFGILLGISALVAALRPVLRISDKIDRYSKLHYGYLEVYYRIEALISEIRSADHVLTEHFVKAANLSERFRSLELEGDAYANAKKLLIYQDEVEQALPSERFWLPSE